MAHAVAVALQPQPISIVLDFVQPVRGVGDAGRSGGEAESKVLGMVERNRWNCSQAFDRSLRIQNATFDR